MGGALTVRCGVLRKIGEREIEKHGLREKRIEQSNFPKQVTNHSILHTPKSTLDQEHIRRHHQILGFEGRERSNRPSTCCLKLLLAKQNSLSAVVKQSSLPSIIFDNSMCIHFDPKIKKDETPSNNPSDYMHENTMSFRKSGARKGKERVGNKLLGGGEILGEPHVTL